MQIRSKMPQVGLTIFATMTALANQHKAINLSQGFPDFDVDPDLIEQVSVHMHAGSNQYAPMQGVLELRRNIAAKVEKIHGAVYNPDSEITITSGATESVFTAISTVVGPADEVIVFEPAYDAYAPIIQLNGGVPVFLKLTFPDYRIPWDALAAAIGPKTRMIVLNSPHNPSGTVLSAEDLTRLRELLHDTQVLILSDEVYEHIIFDGLAHESISRDPELAKRSFVISSFGKTYNCTGWKIGYCLAPEPLSREFQKIHQYLTFAANTPVQCAFADFMRREEIYRQLAGFYQQKRDLFVELIADSRFEVLPCKGTYFQMLSYQAISDEADIAFARRLTIDHGVAAIPPSVFYHGGDDHRVLRFCFAKGDDTLAEAARRLRQI